MSNDTPSFVPPVDVSALMRRCMNDADFARKTLQRFSHRVGEDYGVLADHIASQRFTEIHRLSHELRVSASHVAANTLKRISFELEQAGIQHDANALPGILARFRAERERLAKFLPETIQLIREIERGEE